MTREGPLSPTPEGLGVLRILAPAFLHSPAGSLVVSAVSGPLCESPLLYLKRLPDTPSPTSSQMHAFYAFWAPADRPA